VQHNKAKKKPKETSATPALPQNSPQKKLTPEKEKGKHLTSPKKQQQQHRLTKNLKKQKTNEPAPTTPKTKTNLLKSLNS
jgi:hypothetical protein